MATRLEDNREVWWLEGVVVGSVLGAHYFGVAAYCGESACSAVRDLAFCLKRGCFVQNKKVSGRAGSPKVEGKLLRFRSLLCQSKSADLLKL
jgi:hypothetical protein